MKQADKCLLLTRYQMPKPKPKRKNVNRIKPEPGYKGLPKGVIESRIISINQDSLKEIDKLEKLVKDYKTLVSMMETEWQPKKTGNPTSMEFIARMRVTLKRNS